MAPKRSGAKVVGAVVKTTKKVVEETIKVAVVGSKQRPTRRGRGGAHAEPEIAVADQGEQLNSVILEEPNENHTVKQIPIEKSKDNSTPTPQEVPEEAQQEEELEEEKEKTKEMPKKQNGKQEMKKRKKRGRKMVEGGTGREGYQRYVYKVLKQVHPDMGISSKAMTVMNNFMCDMFERIAAESARLLKNTGRQTLSSWEIQGAVKLILPGELGKHAMAEGTKALSNYMSNSN
ncbi:Histone H2A/H2B/H3 [Dillenia turbinata]|uniref:Histone H2A/H2B/H3 n=1 Tax=Dillenia turbinata TaxID=194707 RepID=A0AAN8VJD5_9MAGN